MTDCINNPIELIDNNNHCIGSNIDTYKHFNFHFI